MADLEAHKQVVLPYVEAFNRGDFATLEDLFAIDALIYGVLGWGESIRQYQSGKNFTPDWRSN